MHLPTFFHLIKTKTYNYQVALFSLLSTFSSHICYWKTSKRGGCDRESLQWWSFAQHRDLEIKHLAYKRYSHSRQMTCTVFQKQYHHPAPCNYDQARNTILPQDRFHIGEKISYMEISLKEIVVFFILRLNCFYFYCKGKA